MVGSSYESVHNALKHATEVRVQHARTPLIGHGAQLNQSRRYTKTARSHVVNGRVLMAQLQHMTQPLTKVA
jgi:hypothetical protein